MLDSIDDFLYNRNAKTEIDNYDRAIVVSGDGDFLSLYNYLDERNKLGHIIIPNEHNYSWLLNSHQGKFVYVSDKKAKLEKTNVGLVRRV